MVVFQAILVVAFRISHEVDALDVIALMEYHSPVRIIVTYWCVDIEAIWQVRR